MTTRNFRQMLEAQWDKENFVCVGLDPNVGLIPTMERIGWTVSLSKTISCFNEEIIEATKDLVCAYKPNVAFYEQYGRDGWQILRNTILSIRSIAPEVPVILDAKRADIGNTNLGYVQSAFDDLGADAITVHPYLGKEAMQPFLDRVDRGVIVLCRTSNPGAGEFQDLLVDGRPLYQVVAEQVASQWNSHGNCALVVGATYPEELAQVRAIVGDMPILIPGIGAQGGDLEAAVKAGRDGDGCGIVINSSRGIIHASFGPDFAEVARRETIKLRDGINQYRLA